jgi:hypothetical protein
MTENHNRRKIRRILNCHNHAQSKVGQKKARKIENALHKSLKPLLKSRFTKDSINNNLYIL